MIENQKNCCFQVLSSLSLYNNNNKPFLQLDCDLWWKVDFIWQLETTSLVVGLRSSKVLPKAKLTPKNGDGHCFGGLLLVWSSTAFWILVKLLHLRSMLSKLMRYTEKFNACSQHWSTEWTQISMKRPNSMFHKQPFKSWMNWAMKFCLICHIHLSSCPPTTISLSISTTFCMLPQPAGLRKCFPRVCQVPKHGFLCYRDKQTYSLLAKMCWLKVPILINKDILESSYDDLKFRVQTVITVAPT